MNGGRNGEERERERERRMRSAMNIWLIEGCLASSHRNSTRGCGARREGGRCPRANLRWPSELEPEPAPVVDGSSAEQCLPDQTAAYTLSVARRTRVTTVAVVDVGPANREGTRHCAHR